MSDEHPNALAYRRTADAFRALSIMGARRQGIDVQTRVVSVFHYRDGQQLERWFHPEDAAAWNRIFEDQV